jgi:hypothetical protein
MLAPEQCIALELYVRLQVATKVKFGQ